MILRFAAETEMDTSFAAWRLRTPIPYSIVAVTAVRTAELPMPQWVEFLERHPEIKLRFEYEVMKLMSEVMAHTITLHLLDAPGAVAALSPQAPRAGWAHSEEGTRRLPQPHAGNAEPAEEEAGLGGRARVSRGSAGRRCRSKRPRAGGETQSSLRLVWMRVAQRDAHEHQRQRNRGGHERFAVVRAHRKIARAANRRRAPAASPPPWRGTGACRVFACRGRSRRTRPPLRRTTSRRCRASVPVTGQRERPRGQLPGRTRCSNCQQRQAPVGQHECAQPVRERARVKLRCRSRFRSARPRRCRAGAAASSRHSTWRESLKTMDHDEKIPSTVNTGTHKLHRQRPAQSVAQRRRRRNRSRRESRTKRPVPGSNRRFPPR